MVMQYKNHTKPVENSPTIVDVEQNSTFTTSSQSCNKGITWGDFYSSRSGGCLCPFKRLGLRFSYFMGQLKSPHNFMRKLPDRQTDRYFDRNKSHYKLICHSNKRPFSLIWFCTFEFDITWLEPPRTLPTTSYRSWYHNINSTHYIVDNAKVNIPKQSS